MTSAPLYTFTRSEELMTRARQVIPSGIYGAKNPANFVPGSYPIFLTTGEGCRIRDVDGNEYIDFLCSFGPIVLGHRHPKVEEAALAQAGRCDSLNLPSEKWVELAELLVSITPAADWAVFAKSGSDVTSGALRMAQGHRPKTASDPSGSAHHLALVDR